MYVCKGGEGHQVLEQPRFLFTLSFMQDNPCRKGKPRLLAINHYIQMGSMRILRFKRSMECIDYRAGIVFPPWQAECGLCHVAILIRLQDGISLDKNILHIGKNIRNPLHCTRWAAEFPALVDFHPVVKGREVPIRIQGNGVLIRLLPAKPTPVLPNVTTSH